MDSHFNIAIIVLVVLAQLGGALVKAWKKRQAGDEAARRQGGLVVVDREPSAEADTDTWGDATYEEQPEPVRQERPASKPPEAIAPGPDTFWEEHKAKEAEPAANAAGPVASRAPEPASAPVRNTPSQVPGVIDLPARARIVGRAPAASRLRRMVNRDTLRQGLIAQVVLERPAITRRLKP